MVGMLGESRLVTLIGAPVRREDAARAAGRGGAGGQVLGWRLARRAGIANRARRRAESSRHGSRRVRATRSSYP